MNAKRFFALLLSALMVVTCLSGMLTVSAAERVVFVACHLASPPSGLIFQQKKGGHAPPTRHVAATYPPSIYFLFLLAYDENREDDCMCEKTLTDIWIERGWIEPYNCPNRLDGDDQEHFVLDGDENAQKEKKR